MQSGEPIIVEGREYRLGSVLSTGAGSYGQVWAATDSAGREVALKFINAEAMSQADGSLHDHWWGHLEREISFLDALRATPSPHIVTLLAHGRVDGQPVLVLEKLQANLGQWLSQQRRAGASPPDLHRVLDWAEQILAGLDVIHRAGFVYRDLKFSNILVGDDGARLKLADFGSLKREDGDSTRSCIGTPATMAPEQILPVRRGDNGCEYVVDCRADYYALGLLLFALLTERSSTAAQRRLGQLLALHGQEGAGQHRDELGGLSDEESELLRRSIEFWTVPVRPEDQQRGAALLLTDLLGRLLARDPAARPASSAAIRAVLDAVRADQPTLTPMASDTLAPPPDSPPNRHPRRNRSAARSLRPPRTVGLIGLAGLAVAFAWAAVIRPSLHREHLEPPSAALVAEPTPGSAAPTGSSPESPGSAHSPAIVAATPPSTEQRVQPAESPRAEATVAEASAPSSEAVPTAANPAPAAAPAAEPAPEPAGESTAKAEATTESGPTTAAATGDRDETVAEATRETPVPATAPNPAASAETPPPATPITPDRIARPIAPATTRLPEPPAAVPALAPRHAVAPPTGMAGRSASLPPGKPASEKTAKVAPISDRISEKPEKSARTPAPAASEPAAARRVAPVPPKAPAIAKPTPNAPESPSPAAGRQSSPAPAKTIGQRAGKAESSPRRETAAAKTALVRPPTTSAAARPVSRSAALPPIELISNPTATQGPASPASPSFERVGRASTTDTSARPRPPIELVSRSGPSVSAPVRPVTPSATAVAVAPNRSPAAAPPKAPARSADPVTAFRQDAGRAANGIRREAENIGNWMGRTGASVGTEIQRGLDSANRAVGNWIGTCHQGNGCSQNRAVERRDRWSRSSQGPVFRSQPTAPDDDDRSRPPSRRVQEYR
jgi:serine/threonine protein kinase